MVKFFLNLLAFAVLFATLAIGDNYIQLNYFTDDACSDYSDSPPNVPLDDSPYNWAIPGTNSAGIANCEGYEYCKCWFYEGADATGNSKVATTLPSGPSCVQGQFDSFECLAPETILKPPPPQEPSNRLRR
jgi:hypothetical protein